MSDPTRPTLEGLAAWASGHEDLCTERYDKLDERTEDMQRDIKLLLAAHNLGKGIGLAAKIAGALIAAGAGIAAFWPSIFGRGH